MARLSAETRFCLATAPTPAAAVGRLNRMFFGNSWEDRFVTLVLCVLDPQKHELTVVNAGHLPPLLSRGNGVVEAVAEEETQLPLGVDPDITYAQCTVPFGPGDRLVLYTDGITEAMNDGDELYGRERLLKQVGARPDAVDALGRQILADVKTFVGARRQSDDVCLVCLGRGE
jgi:phosphoserine phosphatase RsbU/P